jgi:hypothetical protein
MNHQVTINFEEFPNIGIVHCKVPDDILKVLYAHLENIEKTNFKDQEDNRKNLLGHMDKEFKMLEYIEVIEPFLLTLADEYDRQYNYIQSVANVEGKFKLSLSHLWVNFQQKHEFNPPHTHTGVLSFVIWMKIPYDIKEEEEVFPINSAGAPRTSKFTFHYINTLGKIGHWVLPVDESFEGVICMFPSELAHSVNPFYTSDDYRVSISGNLKMVVVPDNEQVDNTHYYPPNREK